MDDPQANAAKQQHNQQDKASLLGGDMAGKEFPVGFERQVHMVSNLIAKNKNGVLREAHRGD